MSRALLTLACHAYALAGVAYLTHLVRLRGRAQAIGAWSLGIGLALHAAVVALRWQAPGNSPVSNLGEALSLTAWLLGLVFLAVPRLRGMVALGAMVTPLVLTVTLTAVYVPEHAQEGPVLGLPGLVVHVLVAFLGVALFCLAAGAALLYLLQERQMKGKRFGPALRRLPPLEALDEAHRRLVAAGFIALSVTIVTGALFEKQRFGEWLALDPKQSLALLAWAVFGGLIAVRVQAGWRGKRVALLTVTGLGILAGSVAGLYLLPSSPHGRAQRGPTAVVEVPHG